MKRQQSPSTPDEPPKPKKVKNTNIEPPMTPQDGSQSQWTKVEKRKQKKATKRAEVKLDTTQPRFMYNNAEIVKREHAISIDDLRDLAVHIIADAPPPNWLRIDNARQIQKVVALLIPGITPALLSLPAFPTSATSNPNLPLSIPLLPRTPSTEQPPPNLPFLAATFSHACPTRAPGDATRMHSILGAFFHGPVSGEERERRMAQRIISEKSRDQDPTQYLLTLEQMIENEYPVPSYMADVFEKPDGWAETPEPTKQPLLESLDKKNGAKQRIYAIDCEMCLTEDGKELTRVCIVDFHSGLVVYDQLVKPAKPVIDYLTRWSGITAAALAPVTTTHSQVQAHILRLLSPPPANPFSMGPTTPSPAALPTPILLGHSLESDLKALKISHPLCIDTALMYHHPRGRPLKPGLAWLTKKWCGREIQTRGEGGHNPEEDARACLDLLKKKLAGGPGFGEYKTDVESIFERMARSTRRAGGGPGSIKSAVVDHGNPAVMHGNKASTAVKCVDDEEVLKGLLETLPSHQFVFGRFMGLADAQGWNTPKAKPDAPTPTPAPPPPVAPSPADLAPVLDSLNTRLKTLHSSLPPRTALLIFTGHSDPRRMAALNLRKTAFESALRSGKAPEDTAPEERWTAGDARDLEEAVEVAKRGLLFLGIRQ